MVEKLGVKLIIYHCFFKFATTGIGHQSTLLKGAATLFAPSAKAFKIAAVFIFLRGPPSMIIIFFIVAMVE